MNNKRKFLRRMTFTAACVLALATVSLAGPGSDKDPLVTLSYLEQTFMQKVLHQVDDKIAERDQRLAQQGIGGQSASFRVVDLKQGEILTGGVGCELLLRAGSASCVSPSAPGLVDQTDGRELNHGGTLVKNHLYLMTAEGRGLKAASAVKVLVRGSCTVR